MPSGNGNPVLVLQRGNDAQEFTLSKDIPWHEFILLSKSSLKRCTSFQVTNSVQDPEERKDPNKHINVEATRQSLPNVTTTSSILLAFRCVLDFTTKITQTYKQTIFKSFFPGTSEAVAACTLTGRLGEWDSFQKLCSLSSLQACFECGRRIRSRRRP